MTDQRIRWAVGEVPESVRLLIDFVGDGVKLTSGGRLPRTVVRSMQEHRPGWHVLGRPAATEDDLRPLVELHRLLRRVGVPNTFETELTELTVGVLTAHGPLPLGQLGSRVHPLLGRGWRIDGQPLTEEDVRLAIARHSSLMEGLDLIDNSNWLVWTIGPSARSLLPRATMLAEIWAAAQ